MTPTLTYTIIFAILLILDLAYFRIADRFNIIDKPNERSSHSTIVLRGGGIIFLLGVWVWAAFTSAGLFGTGAGMQYPWFLAAVTVIAGVSFVDDIRSLPDSVRLVAQFIAMAMMFYQLDILHLSMWWMVILALIVCVGASNVINFMDGINGITGGYALAVLLPVMAVNILYAKDNGVELVFCLFNLSPSGFSSDATRHSASELALCSRCSLGSVPAARPSASRATWARSASPTSSSS